MPASTQRSPPLMIMIMITITADQLLLVPDHICMHLLVLLLLGFQCGCWQPTLPALHAMSGMSSLLRALCKLLRPSCLVAALVCNCHSCQYCSKQLFQLVCNVSCSCLLFKGLLVLLLLLHCCMHSGVGHPPFKTLLLIDASISRLAAKLAAILLTNVTVTATCNMMQT